MLRIFMFWFAFTIACVCLFEFRNDTSPAASLELLPIKAFELI